MDIDAGAKYAKVDKEVSPVMHIGTRRPWPEFRELLQILKGAVFIKWAGRQGEARSRICVGRVEEPGHGQCQAHQDGCGHPNRTQAREKATPHAFHIVYIAGQILLQKLIFLPRPPHDDETEAYGGN